MNNYIHYEKGPIVDVATKKRLGFHDGLVFYTIYQRKNLNLSGQAEPMFVCGKDFATNTLLVCKKSQIEQYIHRTKTVIANMHWISQKVMENDQVYVRFRHGGVMYLATVAHIKNDLITLKHDKIITTAPGQYVVLYSLDQTLCFGGGVLAH